MATAVALSATRLGREREPAVVVDGEANVLGADGGQRREVHPHVLLLLLGSDQVSENNIDDGDDGDDDDDDDDHHR